MTGNGRNLTLVPRCQPCGDTGVMHLAAHWTGLDTAPAVVTCPHCRFPYLPVQTYHPGKATS